MQSFENVKKKEVKHKFELIQPKHSSAWKTRFVLPDSNHCIDHEKIQYLDKGQYSVGDEALIEPPPTNSKGEFRLYFKSLGARDKDKVFGELPNSQRGQQAKKFKNSIDLNPSNNP